MAGLPPDNIVPLPSCPPLIMQPTELRQHAVPCPNFGSQSAARKQRAKRASPVPTQHDSPLFLMVGLPPTFSEAERGGGQKSLTFSRTPATNTVLRFRPRSCKRLPHVFVPPQALQHRLTLGCTSLLPASYRPGTISKLQSALRRPPPASLARFARLAFQPTLHREPGYLALLRRDRQDSTPHRGRAGGPLRGEALRL